MLLATRSALRGGVAYQLVAPLSSRYQSTGTPRDAPTATTAALSPRWLSESKERIGKCITFGLSPEQTSAAADILQQLARDWRELVAGSEGYLTSKSRRGMYRQEVVWGEMDSMGHVNNVTYNRYAESGRIQWAQKLANYVEPTKREAWVAPFFSKGIGMILKSITTDYKFPMTWPDHVTIYHKIRNEPVEGTSSFILDVVILSELHKRPAARLVEDLVVYDYRVGKKTPLQPFMLDVFRETWELQEQAKRTNSERVAGLLDQVRALEEGSWDKAGAVEDMGTNGR